MPTSFAANAPTFCKVGDPALTYLQSEQDQQMNNYAEHPTGTGRRLGATEELFWLYNFASPFHFVMAATITGRVEVGEWRRALNALQIRNPLMRMRIDPMTRAFVASEAEIPLRGVSAETYTWQEEMERELVTPFSENAMPLIRATCISGVDRQTILLAAHHSIADGISISFALHDLLRAVAGAELGSTRIPEAHETTFLPSRLPPFRGDPIAPAPTATDRQIRVEGAELSRENTSALLAACRRNGTTLQGALCAALVSAGSAMSAAWRDGPVRILVPVSTDPASGRGVHSRVAITVNVVTAAGGRVQSGWALASELKGQLLPAQEQATIRGALSALTELIGSGPTIETAAGVMTSLFGSEGMVTNVGALPFSPSYGRFDLERMWGPAILTGSPGEQVLGALTVNGALHLTLSNQAPLVQLMPSVVNELMSLLGST
jgi:hypothetical protein